MFKDFYPETLKPTKAETVGKWYKRARQGAFVLMCASGILFGYVNQHAGFWTLLVGATLHMMLLGREYYIDFLRSLNINSDLKNRLIEAGQAEHVLETIAADSVWHGLPVNPEVAKRLADIKTQREEIKNRLENFLTKVVGEFGGGNSDKPGGAN